MSDGLVISITNPSPINIDIFEGIPGEITREVLFGEYINYRQVSGVDTDGDWRQYADSNGFYIQVRVEGAWQTKQTIAYI